MLKGSVEYYLCCFRDQRLCSCGHYLGEHTAGVPLKCGLCTCVGFTQATQLELFRIIHEAKIRFTSLQQTHNLCKCGHTATAHKHMLAFGNLSCRECKCEKYYEMTNLEFFAFLEGRCLLNPPTPVS